MSKKTAKTSTSQLKDEVDRLLKNSDAISLLIRRDTLASIQDQLHRLDGLEK